jgi:hypothetical protein
VIADERPQFCEEILRWPRPSGSGPIGAHCAWRNIDTQLFTDSSAATRAGPKSDSLVPFVHEFADVLRNSWPTSLRLPFQNNWKPLRCQPIRVSGLTMTKASFNCTGGTEDETDTNLSVRRLGWTVSYKGQLLSQEQDPRSGLCERNNRRKKRSASATRSVIVQESQ